MISMGHLMYPHYGFLQYPYRAYSPLLSEGLRKLVVKRVGHNFLKNYNKV